MAASFHDIGITLKPHRKGLDTVAAYAQQNAKAFLAGKPLWADAAGDWLNQRDDSFGQSHCDGW